MLVDLEIDYLGEGLSDLSACRKLITAAGAIPGVSYFRPVRGTGKQNVDMRLAGLNAVSHFGRPILVLRDLDHDASCAPKLVKKLIKDSHDNFLLRICVRELEVWLMADRNNFAKYCGCKISTIPKDPELLADPKATIVGWADAGSASKLRSHLTAARAKGVPEWAALGQWHSDFAENHWDILAAIESGRAPSLGRAFAALQACVARLSSG